MFTQKLIFKLLNITKSSRFLFVMMLGVISFSLGYYQFLDIPKESVSLFSDSSIHASPPWPD